MRVGPAGIAPAAPVGLSAGGVARSFPARRSFNIILLRSGRGTNRLPGAMYALSGGTSFMSNSWVHRRSDRRAPSSGRRRDRRTRPVAAAAAESLERRVLLDGTVTFNEVMYHPLAGEDTLEWLELHSQMAVDMDLSGWRLAGGADYTFPAGTVLRGGGYLVVAINPAALQAAGGYAGALGPFAGRLDNAGEELRLLNNSGRVMDTLDYGDAGDWPVGPDGGGVSLAKPAPGRASNGADNWTVSAQIGGTPGAVNFPATAPVVDTSVVPALADWKYEASGTDPGTGWRQPGFNDAAWPTGGALFHGGGAVFDPAGSPAGPAPQPVITANGSFEQGPLNPSPGYGPLTGWTVTGATSGHSDAAGPYLNGLPVPDGGRVGFVQFEGSIAQTVTGLAPGKQYAVEYFENERGMGGRARPSVTLAGATVVAARDVTRTDRFRRVISQPFTAGGSSAELVLRNSAPRATFGDNTALFDAVSVRRAAPRVVNGGFEDYAIPNGDHEQTPVGAGWTFAGRASGLSHNDGGYQGAAAAPEGEQVAFIQFQASMSQTVAGFEPGARYSLSWAEQHRTNVNVGPNDLEIVLDAGLPSQVVLSPAHLVTNTSFEQRTSAPFVAAKASYTLTFRTNNPNGGDHTTFADDVRFNFVSEPLPLRTSLPTGRTTHYFRSRFEFSGEPRDAIALLLTAAADDGAVFYLNGTEIYRHNMPAGAVGHATAASSAVGNAKFFAPVTLPASALVRGTNVLAVEVHQAAGGAGGDVLFGAGLTARVNPLGTPPPVALNEVAGAADAQFAVELMNHGTAPLDLGGYVLASSAGTAGSPRQHTLPAGTSLAPGGRLALTEGQLGFDALNGDKLFLYSPGRSRLLDAVAVAATARGRSGPEGTGPWRFVTSPTFGGANAVQLRDEVVISEIMYHRRPDAAVPAVVQESRLVAIDSVWKHDQSGRDLGPDWRQVGYNDAAWPAGAGLLYVEDAALPGPKNTPLTIGRNTYYFRKTFTYNGGGPVELTLNPVVDDGAVFYLNGVEIHRQNMTPGAVAYATPAAAIVVDATYAGPITVPAVALVQGTNVLAVEVHQAHTDSTDVAFGAELTARVPTTPAVPFRESSEQWVELHNRSAAALDLSGWRLDDGVEYTFPAGTTLAAGGYLAVAQDAAALRALHPGATVLGNFDRDLGDGSDRVLLKDARGNVADEVRYYDGGRWPEYADGGGASLELRDPDADNTVPESWAASDEGARTAWRTYSYRAVAGYSANPDGLWNEFVLGLLDGGEVLLDDVRVVDLSNGNQQLIQNTTFDPDLTKWRVTGNHRAEVVNDPSNPANKVMRLIATGPVNEVSNHAETTLAGNTPVVNGHEYEISYRARWVGGSPLLNTRLYFNRAARTTPLDQPPRGGTPGARNSRFTANAGPTFDDFRHGPRATPRPGEAVTVSAVVRDPDGVASASLKWRADGASAWNTVAMAAGAGAGGLFTASVPGQPAGTVVPFYVEARDGLGAVSTFPAAGPDSRALYKVEDGLAPAGALHNFRVIMTSVDATLLHANTNKMSNGLLGTTVVYDEAEVYYDVGARLKGSIVGREPDALFGLVVRFDDDRPFRGTAEQVGIDRSGRGTVGSPGQDEILIRHALHHAGDIPAWYDDLVRVVTPRAYNTSTALLQLSPFNGDYLESQYGDGGGDSMSWEIEVLRWVTSTTDGNPESPKIQLYPNVYQDADLQNRGDDKETYRPGSHVQSGRDRDDFSRLIDLNKAFSAPAGELGERVEQVMDVDQWTRAFAAQSLAGNADTYGRTAAHNFSLYVRPSDQRIVVLPSDMDSSYGLPVNAPLWGESNFTRVITTPGGLHLYYGHLKDLIDTTFNTTYLGYWASHYGSMVGQNWGNALNYIAQRSAFVRGQLPPQVPFRITTNGGNDFSTADASVTIAGDGWIDVKQIFIEGRSQPLDLVWSDVDSWSATVPLTTGANRLDFRAYDFQGRPVAADVITVTSTASAPNVVDHLRVTEVMYHPAAAPAGSPYGDNDFEFVEVQNIGAQPLAVGGVSLLVGVVFTFPAGTTLAPGEHAVVVENPEAFRSRYGPGPRIIGQFTDDLGNAGERLRMEGPAGQTILDFTYGDDDWYPTTDGPGHSLVIRNPRGPTAAWGGAAGWRPSTALGGSPGAADPEAPASVAGRWVFYNRSTFDGNDPAANAADDAAVATDKTALLLGRTATPANYTGYSRGINGVMIDLAGMPAGAVLTAADFLFRAGNTGDPAAWPAPPPPAVSLRRGAGTGGTDRVTLTWPDAAIQNKWLQVTVPAGGKTALAAADVFYFGNAVGDTMNSTTAFRIDSQDVARTRDAQLKPTTITGRFDHNRDGRVNTQDQMIARNGQGFSLATITAPASQATAAVTAAATPPQQPATPPTPKAARRPADDLATWGAGLKT